MGSPAVLVVQGILNFLADPYPPGEKGEKLASCMFWNFPARHLVFFF